jgi:hypothetical protein
MTAELVKDFFSVMPTQMQEAGGVLGSMFSMEMKIFGAVLNQIDLLIGITR